MINDRLIFAAAAATDEGQCALAQFAREGYEAPKSLSLAEREATRFVNAAKNGGANEAGNRLASLFDWWLEVLSQAHIELEAAEMGIA